MAPGFVVAIALATAGSAASSDGYVTDLSASTWVRLASDAQLPGPSGVVLQPRLVAAIYGSAFLRVTGVDLPWAKDALSGELSAWGALGALATPQQAYGDGDLQVAWLQHATRLWRVRLGRQVTLPGAARYVRFDGASAGLRLGPVDASAYFGLVTLPRFVQPRGYYVLGSIGDVLRDPTLLELQARPGQWLAGAQVAYVRSSVRASLGFHEQRGPEGVSFRNLSADVHATPPKLPASWGGRAVLDLQAAAVAEARLYADLWVLEALPLAVDYVYAAPALLLPHTSVLAAFGGESWHELGADATYQPWSWLRLTARVAGQLYSDGRPGVRLAVRAKWTPDLEGRWSLLGEYARVSAPLNGYHHLRGALRYQATKVVGASADVGGYLYDLEVRGAKGSLVGNLNLELFLGRGFKALVSSSVASTPFAAFDLQGLLRVVYELDGPSAGGGA